MVFPEVSLPLDSLVEKGEDDDEEKSVENTKDGEATGLWVRARTCSNKYLHFLNIDQTRHQHYNSDSFNIATVRFDSEFFFKEIQ